MKCDKVRTPGKASPTEISGGGRVGSGLTELLDSDQMKDALYSRPPEFILVFKDICQRKCVTVSVSVNQGQKAANECDHEYINLPRTEI